MAKRSAKTPADVELLRFIAREEPLAATLGAYRHVDRERLREVLAHWERVGDRVE